MKTRIQTKPATKPVPNSNAEQRIIEHIRKRAYELWEAGGCQHGSDMAHWTQAEQEIRRRQRPSQSG